LLASRSAPEGRSVVRSTANSTSTVYIIGTDKIAYEIAENSKFITDSNVLDELARAILQDVSEGPVVRNYSTYAVQALADICAAGCSVGVISEIDPFVMDIMELGSSDERWDTTDIAEAWANMISGQPADTLRSETLPRLLALAQDPDKAGLQMRATTRAFALALEQLARTDHSKNLERQFLRSALTMLLHPTIHWEDRRRIFGAIEQLAQTNFDGSISALLAWAHDSYSIDIEDLDVSI
jgi:hypothetical protein